MPKWTMSLALASACAACLSVSLGGDSSSDADNGDDGATDCTLIGCSDGASVRVLHAGPSWVDGSYALTFEFDATAYACTMSIENGVPKRGPVFGAPFECTPHLDAFLNAEPLCTAETADGGATESCSAVDDLQIHVTEKGEPKLVKLRVVRDGQTVFERSRAFAYKEFRPNGPGCEPICQTSSADFEIE